MSEREIRRVLRDVCADLERHSRRVVRRGVRKLVLPTVLGAGLAMTGCDTQEPVPAYGVPADAGVEAGSRDMMYGAPDWGPLDVLPYMAPDAGPKPDLMYGVPDWGPLDVLPYMAPDAGSPDLTDKGPMPPYKAPPFPDEDEHK